MKVAIIFLLSALALFNLAGNATARSVGKGVVCNDELVGCPRIYDPVCGSDGTTYPNECELCLRTRERVDPVLIRNYGPCGRSRF